MGMDGDGKQEGQNIRAGLRHLDAGDAECGRQDQHQRNEEQALTGNGQLDPLFGQGKKPAEGQKMTLGFLTYLTVFFTKTFEKPRSNKYIIKASPFSDIVC